MKIRCDLAAGWLCCLLLLLAVAQTAAQHQGQADAPSPLPFVVIELFTSEG